MPIALILDSELIHLGEDVESALGVAPDEESMENFEMYSDFVARRADELRAMLFKCLLKSKDADTFLKVCHKVVHVCEHADGVGLRFDECKRYKKEGLERKCVTCTFKSLMKYRKGMSKVNEWTNAEKEVAEEMRKLLGRPKETWPKEDTCTICWDARISILTKPCNHMVSCEACAHAITTCGMCRARITKRLRRSELEEGTKVYKC